MEKKMKYKLNTTNTLSAAEKVSGNILINTVKPVYNGHPWVPKKVAIVHK
jgi:hypothetical protein